MWNKTLKLCQNNFTLHVTTALPMPVCIWLTEKFCRWTTFSQSKHVNNGEHCLLVLFGWVNTCWNYCCSVYSVCFVFVAKAKLGLQSSQQCTFVLECDGTEVEGDVVLEIAGQTLMLLNDSEIWTRESDSVCESVGNNVSDAAVQSTCKLLLVLES